MLAGDVRDLVWWLPALCVAGFVLKSNNALLRTASNYGTGQAAGVRVPKSQLDDCCASVCVHNATSGVLLCTVCA